MDLFTRYQSLWLKLKNKEVGAGEAGRCLGTSRETARVLLNRMRRQHMLVTQKRGRYRLLPPTQWIKIRELKIRDLPVPEELIQDLAENSEHVKAIILYGSWIRGERTPQSDLDILLLSDKKLPEITGKKYPWPVSVEVQPTRGYDRIYVQEAIKKGEVVYDSGITEEIMKTKKTKGDYTKKLGEIQKTLFKLKDDKLFESLTLMDLSHILYANYRGLEIIEENLSKKKTKAKVNKGILDKTRRLYQASKSGQHGIPEVTRKDLRKLRDALTEKWVELKTEVDIWVEKRR